MKYGVIGTSWITEMFIDATKQTKRAQLVAVYSRTTETAQSFAEKNGATNWYTDLTDFLQADVDFIYIASPNVLHYEHILKCIEKGKHVFCEKPMVYTEQQYKHIYEQAKKQNVFIFEGFRHLYSPNYNTLKDRLADIGPVRSALLHFIQYSSRYDAYKDGQVPNVFSKDFAGGALMDLGVYPLSMAIDLFGEPNDVNYFPIILSTGAEGSGTLVLTYEKLIVTLMFSKMADGKMASEIHGEKGTLTIDHIAPISSLKHFDRENDVIEELAVNQHEIDMVYEVESFVDMIEKKDVTQFEQVMERSRLVAKWSETARKIEGITFPGE